MLGFCLISSFEAVGDCFEIELNLPVVCIRLDYLWEVWKFFTNFWEAFGDAMPKIFELKDQSQGTDGRFDRRRATIALGS